MVLGWEEKEQKLRTHFRAKEGRELEQLEILKQLPETAEVRYGDHARPSKESREQISRSHVV